MRRAAFALLLLAGVVGCYRLQTLRRQASKLDRYVAVEGRVTLGEEARAAVEEGATLVVQLLRPARSRNAPDEIVSRSVLFAPGDFHFSVPRARYHVVTFVDENGDLALDAGEWWAPPTRWSGAPLALEVDERAEEPSRDAVLRREYELGVVVDLDDPRFGPESGEYGIFQPLRWPRRYPMGIFFVEPWDPDRTPVLFIYGIGGHASQLAPWIDRLDRARYQPWIASYPTGLPVDLVAEWLARSLDELYARYELSRLCVVAHSMGGLAARAMLGRYDDDSFVRGLTTVATPFGGVPSAAFGVSWSPAVAPAWRDLVPDGPFLSRLFALPGPRHAQRDLVFLYENGRASDGVVPLVSQLRAEAQEEVQRRAGFPLGHAEVFESDEVWAFIAEGLDRCANASRDE
ncbi:MAG: alpha/beta hydrolase [Myxococcales bacterium]|nr:alpha/beta hydrolase [Myxococcales bacterium]